MAPRPDEVLTLAVDLDAKAALQSMAKFQRLMNGKMVAVTKAVEHLGKVNKKAMQEAVDGSKDWLDELDDLSMAHDKEASQLDKVSRQIDALRKRQKGSSGEAKKGIGEQIKLLEKQAGTLSSRVSAKLIDKAASNKIRANVAEGLQKGIDLAAPAFQSFFSKDLKGMVESGTKGLGKVLGFGLEKGAIGAFKAKMSLKSKGESMSAAGKEKGGAGGLGMRAAGGMMKAVGGLVGGFSKVFGFLAKLGPILSVVSSVFMSLVKIFIDAEAQAKQFQKEILATASTSEYLAKAGGDTDVAYANLKDTLSQVRDAAYDLENLKWGITAEDHKQVINVLTQEGVSMMRIKQEAEKAGKSTKEFVADLTHVSVVYSRAFGIPLQEINQMQGEMMTDMGMSLDETQLAFSQMTRSASESGIAANKFFGMIRGVSQDLSLYNTRMEDAVKTLAKLGKVMSPRNAQKFLQTAMQGLKQMGRQERLRLTLLAGTGNVARTIDRDLKQKANILGEKIGMKGEEVAKVINTKGAAGLEEQISKLDETQQGAVREMAIQMQLQTTRKGKGTFGVSGAAADVGPAAALQLMEDAVGRFAGTKDLEKAVGSIGAEMMAENLGISQEQLDSMTKFKIAIDMERTSLKSVLDKQAKGVELTADETEKLAQMQKAGLTTSTAIDSAGYDQIYQTMDESTKKQHKDAGKVEDFAKKQGDLTQSILDKLGVLVDFVMNQIYNAMSGIWEGLLGLWDAFTTWFGQKSVRLQQEEARKKISGMGPEAMKEFQKSGKDAIDFLKYKQEQARDIDRKASEDVRSLDAQAALDAAKAAQEDLDWAKSQGLDTTTFQAALDEAQGAIGKFDASTLAAASADAIAGLPGISNRQLSFLQNAPGTGGFDDPELQKRLSKMLTQGTAGAPAAPAVPGASTVPGAPTVSLGGGKDLSSLITPTEATADATKEGSKAQIDLTHGALTDSTLYMQFSQKFLRGKFKKTMEEVLLDSIRTALFEFYLYSKYDPKDLATYLKTNTMTSADLAKTFGERAQAGDPGDWLKPAPVEGDAPKNARGGLVTDVNGGLATVRAAAGEGLASVGPGERIMPAGAGGGSVTIPISVNGVGANDLARVIQARVIDGIAEYKRRERFT